MGLFEVLGQLPRLLGLIKTVSENVKAARPDMLITIDLPDFNFEVVKRLRKSDLKTQYVHYVAPSVWAWRKGRAKKIAHLYDRLLCLFPFEPHYFIPHGLQSVFVGHPLTQNARPEDAPGFRARYGLSPENKVLGLFFGSRGGELKTLSQTLLDTAAHVQEENPAIKYLVPTLPHHHEALEALFKTRNIPAIVTSNPADKWNAFAACDAAIAVSGTVGLELAYLGVPHAIFYKANPLSILIAKYLIKIKYIHLANIILDAPVIPEFIQDKAKPEKLAAAALLLLKGEGRARTRQIQNLKTLQKILGARLSQTPAQKAASTVLEIL